MADNIQLPSSTYNVATDEVAGVHYPRTKIVIGANGVNDGDVSSQNPLPVVITSFPVTQEVSGTVNIGTIPSITVANPVTSVTVSNLPVTQDVSGTVEVSNFPVTQPVSGTVAISNPVTSVAVSNLPSTQAVSGTVNIGTIPSITVSNLPVTQAVSGTVAVSNLPSVQDVSGTVDIGSMPSVTIANFPVTQPVSGTVAISNPVTSVSVSNLPATQDVAGTISIDNFPTTQAVSGTVNIGTLPSVSISNFPGTQTVSGAVTVSNPVTSVSVSNLPATQAISATTLPLPSGASTESTLAQLKAVTDTLLVAVQAMQSAVESLNTKTTSVNTGSISGNVSVSNFTDNGLTDSQLRASSVSTNDNTSHEILNEIRNLSENMGYFAQTVAGATGRLDVARRTEVNLMTSNAQYTNLHINAVGSSSGASITLLGMPHQLSNMSTTSIYSNITFA